MAAINYQELGRMCEADRRENKRRAPEFIREAIVGNDIRLNNVSFRRLAEATVPDGREWVESLDPRYNGGFREAAGGPVDTSTFSNITGQIVYSEILQAYENPAFIGDQLAATRSTPFSGEKIPGISGIGDDVQRVSEGAEYPKLGVSQEYIETPETEKRGGIVEVTKEAIFFDRTGILLERCNQLGYWMGLNKEKRIISVACGVTNNYRRNGTAYNTYVTTAGHGIVNQITDALVDWTDLNAAWEKFMAMTDFTTGESIVVMPNVLLVPHALYPTAMYILNSTEIRGGTSNTTAYQTISIDPSQRIMTLRALTSPVVYSVTSQSNDWWIGDFQRAFRYYENWGITTETQGGSSEDAFTRDIVQKYKVSERGVAAVFDPHYVVQSTGGS
jgi:hypothetical protein